MLRAEGLVIGISALIGYIYLDGALWLLLTLALAPDLSMLGYIAGSKTGSITYNAFHTYSVPVSLTGYWYLTGTEFVLLVSLIWIGHIGIDRALGYGLKYETGFRDTHLSRQQLSMDSKTEK